VVLDLPVLKIPQAGAHFFEQILIMRDKKYSALVSLQGNIQRID
jgi:hypothetical protein